MFETGAVAAEISGAAAAGTRLAWPPIGSLES
jgi:hypothetical protein